jgi:CBS domain-containing protein
MLLKDICTPEAVYCTRDTTALEAARLMRQKHVGDLVVVDDPRDECVPVGMVTDRDLVVKVLGNELDPAATTVGRIMRVPLVTARDTEYAAHAMQRMHAHGVRRIPVVGADGRLVGMVALDDLLKVVATEATTLAEIVIKEHDHERRTMR